MKFAEQVSNRRPPLKYVPWLRNLRISIATKMILGFLIIIIMTSALFIIAGVQTISKRVVEEGEEKVRNDLNAAREIYLNKLEHITGVIRLTANRYLVREALLNGNLEPALEQLIEIKQEEGLDVLTITDKYGYVLMRASNHNVVGDNQGQDELVNSVLYTKKPLSATVIISGDELEKESPVLAKQAFIKFIDTPLARTRVETEETSGMMLKAAAPIAESKL